MGNKLFKHKLDHLYATYAKGMSADYRYAREDDLSKIVVNSNILVSGAGSIGSFLVKYLIRLGPKKLVVFDHDQEQLNSLRQNLKITGPACQMEFVLLDLNDLNELDQLFARNNFQYVFHTAALKHLPPLEEDVVQAVRTNTLATIYLFRYCEKYGIERCVYVSTDKAVSPISVLGRTKLLAENWIRAKSGLDASNIKITIARFGNVYGSAGSVVPNVERQLIRGETISLTDPRADRYFISSIESIDLILSSFHYGANGKTYICDMGEPIPIPVLIEHLAESMSISADNRIQTVGLRPGEKISEQIAEVGAGLIPMEEAPIYEVDFHNWRELSENDLIKLEMLVKEEDKERLQATLIQLTS